jgi:glycosyltransferase involved in cell wall biosynthesis
MTVSVLIPAKGLVPYLVKSLESVLSSSLKPNEIVLVDDGIDPLHLKNIRSNFSSSSLKVIKNEGKGLVDALNTGIYAAKSTFIARLDSDDFVTEERFVIQTKILDNNPEVVVIGSQINFIDKKDYITGRSNYPVGVLNDNKSFYTRSLLAHPSVMIRKDALVRVNGYRETISLNGTSLCEDFDLWRRIADQGTLVNLSETLTYYRQHESQLSVENSAAQALATFIIGLDFFKTPKKAIKLETKDNKIVFPEYIEILQFVNRTKKLLFILKTKLLGAELSSGVLKHIFLSKFVNLYDRILRVFN